MLKEHLLLPQQVIHNNMTFRHYLSAGSHQSPYNIKGLTALSRVYLPKNQRLPTLPPSTAILLLKGCLRIDGIQYKSDSFVAGKLIRDGKGIINENEQTADLILIVFKDPQWKQNHIQVRSTQEQKVIQMKRELILLLQGQIYGMGNSKISTTQNPNAIVVFDQSEITITAHSSWLTLILQ